MAEFFLDTYLPIVLGVIFVVLGIASFVLLFVVFRTPVETAAPLPAPAEPEPPQLADPAKVLPMPYGRWVWVASPGRSVLAHHPQHTGYTACGWRIDGYGHVVLSGTAVENYQVSPCMRCFPGVPVMPGRLP